MLIIDITRIQVNKQLPAKSEKLIRTNAYLELLESIRARSILVPMCVEQVAKDKYNFLDGLHRYQAALDLRLT